MQAFDINPPYHIFATKKDIKNTPTLKKVKYPGIGQDISQLYKFNDEGYGNSASQAAASQEKQQVKTLQGSNVQILTSFTLAQSCLDLLIV